MHAPPPLLRERDGLAVSLQVQVDTLAHRIPRFIDKACQAGVNKVFVGLEHINTDNLAAVKMLQNRITEYRDMFLAWKRYSRVITCGYIFGFPQDTRDSVLRDIDIIKQDLPIDILYLTVLTPLPGSEDHKRQLAAGTWMDPDLNKYDVSHSVTRHRLMSPEEFDAAFVEAWRRFYTRDHVERVMRRAAALGSANRGWGGRRACPAAVHRLSRRGYASPSAPVSFRAAAVIQSWQSKGRPWREESSQPCHGATNPT